MAAKDTQEIIVQQLHTRTARVAIVGTTPLIFNAMSQKAIQELLLPKKKLNAADKATNVKHDCYSEFRSSPYKMKDPNAPALLCMPSTAIRGSIRSAALDLPGATKSQLGRLTYVRGDYVPIYGVPQIMCSVVRSADINRTPDVRTRAIAPRWAAVFEITFVVPHLNEDNIARLIAAAGVTIGLGDWRPEKGKGDYGQFRVAGLDDEELKDIIATGGREAQIAALAEPEAYDVETETLLSWFHQEAQRRGLKVAA